MRYVIVLLALCSSVSAQSITSVDGLVQHGETLVITGTSFGTKSPATPLLWANWDESDTPNVAASGTSVDIGNYSAWHADEGVDDTGCIKCDNWGVNSQSRAVFIQGPTWNKYGMKWYAFKKQKQNFYNWDDAYGADTNFKLFRTSVLGGDPSGTGYFVETSDAYSETNVNGYVKCADFPGCGNSQAETDIVLSLDKVNLWTIDELEVRNNALAQAHPDTNGGAAFKWWRDGELAAEGHPWAPPGQYYYFKTRDTNCVDHREFGWLYLHHTRDVLPDSGRVWFDDCYVDSSWARVMVGNASTLAASTHREIQIPSAWSATEIEVTVNRGSFAADANAYLFVVDSSGTPSPGYAIQFGDELEGGQDNAAPGEPAIDSWSGTDVVLSWTHAVHPDLSAYQLEVMYDDVPSVVYLMTFDPDDPDNYTATLSVPTAETEIRAVVYALDADGGRLYASPEFRGGQPQ
jgi:hypothetical protein